MMRPFNPIQPSRQCPGSRSPFSTVAWSCAVALCTLAAVPVHAQFSFVTNNNELTITGYSGPAGDVALPDSSDGLPVTAVATRACWFNNGIVTLTATNPALVVGDQAFFRCGALTNVTLGSGVTNIGLNAFSYNTSLLAINVDAANQFYSSLGGVLFDKNQATLVQCPGGLVGPYNAPPGVSTIGSNAFYYCTALSSVVLPDTVTEIQDSGFSNCGMTNIVLGTNLTTIGPNAFFQSGLRSITLPASVTNIGLSPFVFCQNLSLLDVDPANPAYSSLGGVLLDKAQRNVLEAAPGKAGSFTLPPTVTNIGPYAFAGSHITNLVVPNGLLSIGAWSFNGGGPKNFEFPDSLVNIAANGFYVSPVVNVTLGAGLTNIGDYAFSSCSFLSHICFRGSPPTLGGIHVFYSSGGANGKAPTVYYVPGTSGWGPTFAGLPTVPWDPVSQCTFSNFNNTLIVNGYIGSSNSVTVPASVGGLPVVAIADSGFYQKTSLTSVSLPASVKTIGLDAFFGCTGLRAINLAGVTNIGSSALSGCANLAEVSFSPGLSWLGPGAFANCPSLRGSLVIPAGVRVLYGTFYGCTNLTSIYCLGDAPIATSPFTSDNNLTVYYLPGTAGWTNTLGGRPTVLWNPQATQAGLHAGGFGFTITGSSNLTLVVEGATNLNGASWTPLATNTLTGGTAPFTDPAASNLPERFYRFRSP